MYTEYFQCKNTNSVCSIAIKYKRQRDNETTMMTMTIVITSTYRKAFALIKRRRGFVIDAQWALLS